MSKPRGGEFVFAMSGLIGIAIVIGLLYTLSSAQRSSDLGQDLPGRIGARNAPVDSADFTGPGSDASLVALAATPAAEDGLGLAIYRKACIACHATGAVNAPKLGDNAAWAPRLSQGLDQLLQKSIDGMGAMPPRGTCMDCSDRDLKVAIEYILAQIGYEAVASAATDTGKSAETIAATAGESGTRGASGEVPKSSQ
ncbi:MAG: c-type cytochrome [Chromatiaceae bacterium]|nr:c-type cytochrome [Chromatiaceae bacterium]